MEQKVNKTDRLAFIKVNMSRLTNVSRTSKTHCTFLLNVYPNKVPPILSHRPDSISKFSLSFDVHFLFQINLCKKQKIVLYDLPCPNVMHLTLKREKHGRYAGIFQIILLYAFKSSWRSTSKQLLVKIKLHALKWISKLFWYMN